MTDLPAPVQSAIAAAHLRQLGGDTTAVNIDWPTSWLLGEHALWSELSTLNLRHDDDDLRELAGLLSRRGELLRGELLRGELSPHHQAELVGIEADLKRNMSSSALQRIFALTDEGLRRSPGDSRPWAPSAAAQTRLYDLIRGAEYFESPAWSALISGHRLLSNLLMKTTQKVVDLGVPPDQYHPQSLNSSEDSLRQSIKRLDIPEVVSPSLSWLVTLADLSHWISEIHDAPLQGLRRSLEIGQMLAMSPEGARRGAWVSEQLLAQALQDPHYQSAQSLISSWMGLALGLGTGHYAAHWPGPQESDSLAARLDERRLLCTDDTRGWPRLHAQLRAALRGVRRAELINDSRHIDTPVGAAFWREAARAGIAVEPPLNLEISDLTQPGPLELDICARLAERSSLIQPSAALRRLLTRIAQVPTRVDAGGSPHLDAYSLSSPEIVDSAHRAREVLSTMTAAQRLSVRNWLLSMEDFTAGLNRVSAAGEAGLRAALPSALQALPAEHAQEMLRHFTRVTGLHNWSRSTLSAAQGEAGQAWFWRNEDPGLSPLNPWPDQQTAGP